MGGNGSVGTVSLNSFYRGTNDTSSPYDLIINFNRSNGSDHIHSLRLTVDDGATSQDVCDNTKFHDDESSGNSNRDPYWTMTDEDEEGTFNYDNDYSDNSYSSGSLHISNLLTQPVGTYTVRVTIYAKDKCKTDETYDSDSASCTNPAGNEAPVITNAGNTLSFMAGNAVTVLDSTVTVTDSDDANMDSARKPSNTTGIFSSADYFLRVRCRTTRTLCSTLRLSVIIVSRVNDEPKVSLKLPG